MVVGLQRTVSKIEDYVKVSVRELRIGLSNPSRPKMRTGGKRELDRGM